jgi:hypothetical protein
VIPKGSSESENRYQRAEDRCILVNDCFPEILGEILCQDPNAEWGKTTRLPNLGPKVPSLPISVHTSSLPTYSIQLSMLPTFPTPQNQHPCIISAFAAPKLPSNWIGVSHAYCCCCCRSRLGCAEIHCTGFDDQR